MNLASQPDHVAFQYKIEFNSIKCTLFEKHAGSKRNSVQGKCSLYGITQQLTEATGEVTEVRQLDKKSSSRFSKSQMLSYTPACTVGTRISDVDIHRNSHSRETRKRRQQSREERISSQHVIGAIGAIFRRIRIGPKMRERYNEEFFLTYSRPEPTCAPTCACGGVPCACRHGGGDGGGGGVCVVCAGGR